MKKTILILAVAAMAGGCHDSSNSLRRDQQNYRVVQEGATGAATSTLTAAGQAPTPMTATNADTTSNLMLMSGAATASSQPGNIAGTMTSNQSGSMNVGYANDGSSAAAPRPRVARPTAPRFATDVTPPRSESQHGDTTAGTVASPMNSAAPAPTPPTSQPPTTSAFAPSPSTNTAAIAPVDSGEKRANDKPRESKPPEPPPSTDTSTTTAPPPTQTR